MSQLASPEHADASLDTPTVRRDERYLIRIKQPGLFFLKDQSKVWSEVHGFLYLSADDITSNKVVLRLEDFGLVGDSIAVGEGETGVLSFRSQAGSGVLFEDNKKWRIDLPFQAEHVSEQIERTLGFPIRVREHGFNSRREIFKGNLTGDIFFRSPRTDAPAGEVVFELRNGRIQLDLVEKYLGTIQTLLIESINEPAVRVFSGQETERRADCRLATPQLLRLQPVGFKDNNGNTTGQSATAQMQMAAQIWGKACIFFSTSEIKIVNDPTGRFTQVLQAPTNATEEDYVQDAALTFSAPTAGTTVVEVFFVADPLTNQGGGVHLNGDSAAAKIVLTEKNGGDPCLLAHELGHIFGGIHAGIIAAATSEWSGEDLTVMEGSAPHPAENTAFNCTHAKNATVLEPINDGCCMHPDQI